MNKRTWVEIDLDALCENYRFACARAGVPVMAVVKANAYGHGALPCAAALYEAGARHFAVACLDEALELRRGNIGGEVLILGVTDPADFEALQSAGAAQTVPGVAYARALSDFAVQTGMRIPVHIKLDTGMGRIGIDARRDVCVPSAVRDVLAICALPGLSVEGIFTHFALSDVPGESFTDAQASRFLAVTEAAEAAGAALGLKHCANSGAILNYPAYNLDMVREGIILYGEKPDPASADCPISPVMTLKTAITFRSLIAAGETVSYGRAYRAESDTPVAVLPVGYADGYHRALSGKATVRIAGKNCPVIGRVCMDQMMADVSACPEVKPGEEAVLFGAGGMSVTALAALCDTIPYELLCAVSPRVPRLYLRGGKVTQVSGGLV